MWKKEKKQETQEVSPEKEEGRDLFEWAQALVCSVLAVVLLAVGTALLAYGGKGEGSLTATVKHRGQVVAQVELSSLPGEKTIAIDGTYHLTVILDKTGAAVTDSDCPGRDCVHTGRITRAGQSIVCLPEQVVVTLEGKTPSADVILG